MKKTVALLLALLLFVVFPEPAALAADTAAPSFLYDLSCGGSHEITAETGDIIEVTFSILRTDADEAFDATALQNRIVFDETFFAFVDAVCVRPSGYVGLKNTLSGRKIYMTDMMDLLESSLVFGTFRLQIIGTAGSGWIRNGSAKLQRLGVNGGVEDAVISCADLCVRIAQPDGEITGCTAQTAAASVRNPGRSEANVRCILAAYDKEGRLLSAAVYAGSLDAGDCVPLYINATGIASVKLFLLEGETGQPLCEAASRAAGK